MSARILAPEPESGHCVLSPDGLELPIVVEVPHAGLRVDPQPMANMQVPLRSLGRDADLFMDVVCRPLTNLGAHVLLAQVSRYVCDLNRAPGAYDLRTGPGGRLENAPHGLFWRATTEGHPVLLRPLNTADVAYRLSHYYDPYHAALDALLRRVQSRFGYAMLLCAHSMPSPHRGNPLASSSAIVADIVPGSRARSTAASVAIDAAEDVARGHGFSVRHDYPYAGGFTTAHYGVPGRGVHALQIEVSRNLYMDEDTLTIRPTGLARVQAFFETLVRAWAMIPPAALLPTTSKRAATNPNGLE